MLTAALAGFFLILEFLVSLLSSGPQDILAQTAWQEETVGLPNGVGLLEAAVLGVSLVLALAVLIASAGWPLSRGSFRPTLSLATGALAAIALAGVGAYLAFSGVLGENVAYSEHTVHRSILEPGGLALIAAIFLTLIIAGFINRYALGLLIVAWLAAASVFGFLDPAPVDGLYLFQRPERLEVTLEYADVVERYQQTDTPLIEEPEAPPEPPEEVEAQQPPVVNISVVADVMVEQLEAPPPVPVFWVSGAFHTRYLRTATGDVYENGTWTQLDPGHLPVDEDNLVPDSVIAALEGLRATESGIAQPERLNQALLAYPTLEAVQYVPDVIVITPYYEGETFGEGVVPSADHLVRVFVPASYYPFSGTLRVSGPTGSYQLNTTVPQFAPSDILAAGPAQDSTYLQLPDDLPARVLELAEQFRGDESPYLRANRLHGFLREKFAYFTPEPGRTVIARPDGQDPIDWFLFERRGGDSRSFSNAFAILARAAGIPARVVAGWAIEADGEAQIVTADQAHQWAEIALEGIGWVRFDPTRHDAFPPDVVEAQLPMLVEELQGSEDPQERQEAAEALGDIAAPEALPALVDAAINDESTAVQLTAETALHKIGTDELIELLLNHEDPLVREAAADGLRVVGTSRAVDPLRQALSSDVDARVRLATVKALEKIGGERAEEGLLQAALSDEDQGVRERSVLALGKNKAAWTVAEIATLLRSDADPVIRAAAAWSLGEIQVPGALLPLVEARSDDPVEAVRQAAAEALLKWDRNALIRVLEESDNPEERATAARLLGELGDVRAAPALVEALDDPEAVVRLAALDALKLLGNYIALENGGGHLSINGATSLFIPGTTALTATKPPHIPVFAVEGASHTSYLRSAVGEIYVNGSWLASKGPGYLNEDYTVSIPYGDIHPTVDAASTHTNEIAVTSHDTSRRLAAGVVPISKRLSKMFVRGTYWQKSATFTMDDPTSRFAWVAEVDDFSDAQLNAAGRWPGGVESPNTALPEWALRGRIHDLAVEITAGHSTSYAQAKAIETYLRTNYTYSFAESPQDALPPPGQDPVDWFLFDKREGTCGTFSSAFVMLARSVGLPARVVSGWAIGQTPYQQTVSTDQAHQWAEVAFEGLGWVEFEPTAAGPGSRAALNTLGGGNKDAVVEALQALEEAGEQVTELENGGFVVEKGGGQYFVPGTTTAQAPGLLKTPLFTVTGAAETGYLRTATGDVYEDGRWRQLDPVTIGAQPSEIVSAVIWRHLSSADGNFADLPFERRANASLLGVQTFFYSQRTDEITIRSINPNTGLPSGAMPVSRDLATMSLEGQYFPYSRTFRSDVSTGTYSFSTHIESFSRDVYEQARPATDPTYLQLPPGLPDRIRALALRITQGQRSTYAKAKAIETYLRTTYPYRLADSPEDRPPSGRDPVDWFLFDHREGTCGVFSSAFVVLARSVGIPARVVSGWAISAMPETQTVKANQAHQWAEIGLENVGWVTIEATASGGPPSRAVGGGGDGGSSSQPGGDVPDDPPPPPPPPLDTVTDITLSPAEVRRERPFTVGGTVYTVTGHTVDGMTVEIYVNETKEHGGTKIGTATTRFGRWSAEVSLPRDMERGPYQLLAHAVANDHFEESWSDPDISVFSGTGLELTGPTRVPVDDEAEFSGKLTEETGDGVEGSELEIVVDGTVADTITTEAFGRFSFTRAFPDPGPHWVEVKLKDQEYLLDNRARINLEVTLPTATAVEAPVSVEVGEEFRVTGTLHGARGEPLEDRVVRVQIGGLPAQQVSTDAEGAFELTGALDSPGAVTVHAEFPGDGPVLQSQATARLSVRESSLLTLNGPSAIELGDGATFTGRLSTTADAPIAQSTLSIFDGGGAELATLTTDDDGGFSYEHEAFFQSGSQSLAAQFPGADFIVASSARFAFSVLAPTSMSLESPEIVRDSETFTLRGSLSDGNGQPVPGVEVEVTGSGARTLTTDADGVFTWEALAVFEQGVADSPHESPFSVEVAFAGSDKLAPSAAAADVVIGVPRVVLEPLEPVARGEAVTLRGTALLGNRPMEGVELTVGEQGGAVSDAAGAFAHLYRVPTDHPLGASEVTVAAADLNISESVSLEVRSAVNIIVSPVDKVRPGELAMLQATLLDDRWEGVGQATLRTDGGVEIVTDRQGVALLELTVPDGQEPVVLPVTFTFDGDDSHMPLTYLYGVTVTPLGFNWLLWVGAPGVVAALAAAGYAGRRMNVAPLPPALRRRSMIAAQAAEAASMADEEANAEEAPVETRAPVSLEIDFAKPAADLPDVWGVGEVVDIKVQTADSHGDALAGVELEVTVSGEDTAALVTGDDGACALRLAADETGEYMVAVAFAGDEDHLPASASRSYRVVDYREEIVRLYNVFLDWARETTGIDIDQATPREVELMLVTRGTRVPQKSLDELISRFEEADYSEHPIARRHYASMYRAWRAVVEA